MPFQGHWEYRTDSNGDPVADKIAADGTVIETVSVSQEQFDAKRRQAVQEGIDTGSAINNALNSAPGQEIISLMVDGGLLTAEEAEAEGWTGPDVSEPYTG